MKNLAIIPARSGSKGLKDKNIKKLAGIPLIGYTIKEALASNIFNIVMVSTDTEKYAEIAKDCGAEVPFLRSWHTAIDSASIWDVVHEVVYQYSESGYDFDTITILQPTSPLRDAQDIIQAHSLFHTKNANTVISVCEAEHSPLWSNVIESDLSMEHFAESDRPKSYRQELKTFYRLNGAIFIANHTALADIDSMYTNKCYSYIMAQSHSIDIDTELDFKYAEFLLASMGDKKDD